MTAFKEFAIGKFVLRFYKTDHVWTCTMTENMLDEVTKELALQRLSDISQEFEQEPVAWAKIYELDDICEEGDWQITVTKTKESSKQIGLFAYPMRELTDEEIIADAYRYRWLRDRHENTVIDIFSARTWKSIEDYKKQLDDLIDVEIAKAEKLKKASEK